jgi:hypothetical protein
MIPQSKSWGLRAEERMKGDGAGSCGWWIRGVKKGACEVWFLLLLGSLTPVVAPNVSPNVFLAGEMNSRYPHFSGLAVD